MATLTAIDTEPKVTARRGIYEPFNEYHQCWYPVALAVEIRRGDVKSLKFCDSRIVVFRGSDGVVRAMSARCKHMGADIGLGQVVGNNVQCPYHHWEYNGTGACVRIPSGDKVPNDTTLFTFPCEEVQGLIWVFLGKEPIYPVPFVPNCEDGKVLSRSFELVLETPIRVEPWVFSTNSFDFAHFKTVHHFDMKNLKTVQDENHMYWESDIEITDEGKEFKGFMRLDAIGTTSVITYMKQDGEAAKRHVVGLLPKGDDGLGIFFTVFAELEDDSEKAHKDAVRRLDELERLHRIIPLEDVDVLNSIEFGKVRLTEVDKELATYLGFVNRFPRTTIRKLEAGD
jgi:phenylpropionate dioxygenase-like ring-hydroxylating dioxygenase large terminal subunit